MKDDFDYGAEPVIVPSEEELRKRKQELIDRYCLLFMNQMKKEQMRGELKVIRRIIDAR